MKLLRHVRRGLILLVLLLLLGRSSVSPGEQIERVRYYTRQVEFDYINWTVDAFWQKIGQDALGTSRYLRKSSRPAVVLDYLQLIRTIQSVESRLNEIFTNPDVQNPQSESITTRQELDNLHLQLQELQPVAEAVLQAQISQVTAELGLSLGGQSVPPVLYHTTAPPAALIISPREIIRQDLDISISPDLTVAQHAELEEKVDRALGVSSLVVGIGGIGLYPTMVMQTTDINWLVEVVAHEWIHNYLTLRPLGLSYMNTPELRIMNETAASIAGKEIGRAVIKQYYPELLPPPPPPPTPPNPTQPATEPEAFNYRTEMHKTRIEVDRLLQEGKVTQAEDYMEMRRHTFWDNGYRLRKINQAFFAFYGAYADEPTGAAGQDPVGAAVRQLRAQSASLTAFVNQISWMWSFEQLQQATQSVPQK